nr:hypothetical protein [Tanacetum cinerariifolium]
MKGYIDNLDRLGHPVTLGLGVSWILIGLRKEYDGFVQNYNMHSMGKTVNELHAMLKLHEQTLPKSNAPALNVIRAGKVQKSNKHKKSLSQKGAKGQNQGKGKFGPKPKIPPPPKRENPAKDSIYHECGEIGHWKRNCPQYLAELMKKKKNTALGAGGSGIFVIELNTILNRSWIYDTGCGTHICNTTQGLRASRKLKPGALSLYVGNGQREAVEAIGAFYLCLLSGLEIVLNNYHYAPSITRGVIFVSRLYEDGFVNRFVDNTIQVSRNNVVYFCAIQRDGIFEIDLSNSLTNKSSVYAVSKKRIEKLQHEGLPIHLTLGHLKNVSLEVFETFTVFQKEIENQLEKTIKSLRSDRGGEYMSQEFLNHLNDHGIIAHRTPPYTPQHSGMSERKNRTLLDMVRYMMSQSILPKSFWDYALETVARILNMVSTEKVEKTPYEVWHGKVPKLSYLKVWGCEALVKRDTLTKPGKSKRTRHAPDRMCLYIDAEEHELGDLRELANYKAALLNRESEKWLNAMNVEMQSMKDNEVWVLVELPPNGKTVGSKWLFKKKTNMDGNVHIYKARLVAKGITQTLGIDYEETFSLVADIRAIRILIAIATYYDYEIWQMDVKTAFLNGYLNEEVYMEQPEGFVNPKYPNRVCKLKHYIYGLKQASRQWNKRFDDEIKKEMFCHEDLGEAAYILEIKIYRDRSKRLIGLCQSAYIEKILKRYCMENSKRESIPMQEKLKLSKSQVYGGDLKRELRVSCYTDAGYLTDADDLKSQTGYVFVLNGGAVDWKSAKQSIFATLSAEAEYIAAFDASKEAVWVKKFISGLSVILTIEEPISMYCDNTGAIAIANESGITKGARHFRAKVHYLREVIEFGDIKLEKVHTIDNFADTFTKALAFPKHSEHTKNIGMLPASSLM